ncbi:MAG: D-alanyl-D-alanine carboxypeptidase family protein [Pseudomonadota bacterium]
MWLLIILPLSAAAAPYAAMVMDARTGEVIHSRNADTRLHPASLTKMMTLYVVFEAVENGEIDLDTRVRISKHAASEPPSKLGLKPGQRIRLRHLIRAAAIKSANDASTALAEAIEGSEAAFARRMNRTAKALGMTRTTFKNAHGLTEQGHLSTARDMTIMGRHLFYDYPEYYNLFSRITADAGVRTVTHTNRKLLRSYRGADGIKTGYTRAAGFNLTASAERGNERIIATVFGGRSTATRNARVAELLDMGFRAAPSRVALKRPVKPPYLGKLNDSSRVAARVQRSASAAAVKRSLRPQARPTATEIAALSAEETAVTRNVGAQPAAIEEALRIATSNPPSERPEPAERASPQDISLPQATPVIAEAPVAVAPPAPEIVTRISTSGGRHWGINVGRYASQYKARKMLLKTALSELDTLDGALRKVVRRPSGFDANFMGMSRESADLACRRLQAKQMTCFMIEPGA